MTEPGEHHDQPHDLRAALLAAVAEIVEERGAREMTLRAVAKRAGASHAAPGHHFGNKEGMLAAFAEEGFDNLGRTFEAAAAQAADRPVAERFREDGAAYVNFAVGNRSHFDVMFRSGLVSPDRPELASRARATFLGLREQVVELHGEQEEEQLDRIALLYWTIVHGMASLWIDGLLGTVLDGYEPDRLVDEILQLATAAIDT